MAERPIPIESDPPSPGAPGISFEDAQLVQQVQSGRVEAYGELVRKYQDRLYNTCWRICGNAEDARDLTQEAFVKGLEGIDAFRSQSKFYTWLFRVAVNLCLTHRRRAKVRQAASLDQAIDTGGTQAQTLGQRIRDRKAERPDARGGRAELQRQVTEALATLDDDLRSVVVLRDLEGFDYQQISEILEVAPGTVKSRLHRARMQLREKLGKLVRRD